MEEMECGTVWGLSLRIPVLIVRKWLYKVVEWLQKKTKEEDEI
jgi:hypothetical protein